MTPEVSNLILNIGISFVSALAGAYAGTRAATIWQQKREDARFESEKEAAILKAVILCRHYAQVISKIQAKITSGEKKLEWFEVNVIEISLSASLEQDTPALLNYLGRKNGELVESLIHAEWVAKSAISVSHNRDIEYRNLQSFLIEKGSPQRITKEHALSLIGNAWAAKLDSQTKELHAAVGAAIEQNRVCHNELLGLLPEAKRKGKELIKIEPTI
jgi:hypothetical protein